MSDAPVYTSRSTLHKIQAHDRYGVLETGERADYGVHGPMAAHYKLPVVHPRAFPVDYIVNATGS
jgi:hypothetical protein